MNIATIKITESICLIIILLLLNFVRYQSFFAALSLPPARRLRHDAGRVVFTRLFPLSQASRAPASPDGSAPPGYVTVRSTLSDTVSDVPFRVTSPSIVSLYVPLETAYVSLICRRAPDALLSSHEATGVHPPDEDCLYSLRSASMYVVPLFPKIVPLQVAVLPLSVMLTSTEFVLSHRRDIPELALSQEAPACASGASATAAARRRVAMRLIFIIPPSVD
jgi:hypothetical protein